MVLYSPNRNPFFMRKIVAATLALRVWRDVFSWVWPRETKMCCGCTSSAPDLAEFFCPVLRPRMRHKSRLRTWTRSYILAAVCLGLAPAIAECNLQGRINLNGPPLSTTRVSHRYSLLCSLLYRAVLYSFQR